MAMQRPQAQETAVIYIRVSSGAQEEDGTSLVSQEDLARQYCAKRGYRVYGVVYQDVKSGANLWGRAGVMGAMRTIEEGKATVLVVYALDRLARDQNHQGYAWAVVERDGGRIESVTEDLDNSASGKFVRSVGAMVAEMERDKIRERTVRGRQTKSRTTGRLQVGPNAMYGYRYLDPEKGKRTTYVEDEESGPVVRRIFREVAEGKTLNQVCEGLNRDGIPTPSMLLFQRGQLRRGVTPAETWNDKNLFRIVRRRAYAGKHAAFDTERSKGPGVRKVGIVTKQTPRSEDDPIRIPITTPALVDSETWERVQALMHTNKLRAARRNSDPEATLLRGGYIVCGYCHHPLAVAHTHKHPDGTRTPVYRCHYGDKSMTRPHQMCPGGTLSINAPLIDAQVWARLEVLTKDPELAAKAYARGMQRAQEGWKAAHNKAGAINTHVRKLEADRDALVDAIRNVSNPNARARLYKDLDDVQALLDKAMADQEDVGREAREAEDAQQEMRRFRQEVVSNAEKLEQFKQEVLALGEELAHNYYAEKRRTLETWGVRVELFRKDDPDHDRWEMSLLNNCEGADRVSYHVKM